MHKLLNYLFGWDYIYWSNSASQGIARVFITHDGRCCYFRYKNIKVIDEIKSPSQVYWLTCAPEKYNPKFLVTQSRSQTHE